MIDKLKKLRLEKRLTQEEVAFELNISQKAYSKIENGKICLSQSKMVKISSILDVSIDNICPIQCECATSNSKISFLIKYIRSNGLELPDF